MEREPLRALINVAQLLKEPIGSSQSHDISGTLNEEEEVEAFVDVKAKVTHISRGVFVQCKLTAEVKLVQPLPQYIFIPYKLHRGGRISSHVRCVW